MTAQEFKRGDRVLLMCYDVPPPRTWWHGLSGVIDGLDYVDPALGPSYLVKLDKTGQIFTFNHAAFRRIVG